MEMAKLICTISGVLAGKTLSSFNELQALQGIKRGSKFWSLPWSGGHTSTDPYSITQLFIFASCKSVKQLKDMDD